ncbi:hypothetical protein C8J57DRAFT_1681103 [Mycena rebaudengoi]|nr:hypothetical protein C8J57DRAFT_1681103 [Mycena rebaudengoi]
MSYRSATTTPSCPPPTKRHPRPAAVSAAPCPVREEGRTQPTPALKHDTPSATQDARDAPSRRRVRAACRRADVPAQRAKKDRRHATHGGAPHPCPRGRPAPALKHRTPSAEQDVRGEDDTQRGTMSIPTCVYRTAQRPRIVPARTLPRREGSSLRPQAVSTRACNIFSVVARAKSSSSTLQSDTGFWRRTSRRPKTMRRAPGKKGEKEVWNEQYAAGDIQHTEVRMYWARAKKRRKRRGATRRREGKDETRVGGKRDEDEDGGGGGGWEEREGTGGEGGRGKARTSQTRTKGTRKTWGVEGVATQYRRGDCGDAKASPPPVLFAGGDSPDAPSAECLDAGELALLEARARRLALSGAFPAAISSPISKPRPDSKPQRSATNDSGRRHAEEEDMASRLAIQQWAQLGLRPVLSQAASNNGPGTK